MRDAPRIIAVAVAIALVAGLSLGFASTGVIADDLENNISVPDELIMELDLKVAYNDSEIFWRYRWDTDTPHFYHDYLVYEDGDWVRYGRSPVGPEPQGLYEDRLTMLVDDGSVDGFRQYGGYMTVTDNEMRFYDDQADPEEVDAIIGEDDVRKFLPHTRTDINDWRTVRPEDELTAMREAGYFLDFWHWRAHRSNPIGWADDTYVFDYRRSDAGVGPFTDNFDEDGLPAFMFDPDITGQYAMNWDRVLDLDYTQDEYYYLSEEIAVPFDPDHDWQNGDAIPRRLLREPDESRGSIFAQGIATNGEWNLDLRRALDTGYPLDDKAFSHLGLYDVAFAVHKNATGSRWHYVSFPFTLGLSRDADIEATRFGGEQPPWDDIEWTTITLFYPGQTGYNHAVSDDHAGADEVRSRSGIRAGHTEDQLAHYVLEDEFRSSIRSQWIFTAIAWVFFVIATTVAVALLTRSHSTEPGLTTEEVRA
jgi:hypothetical protein